MNKEKPPDHGVNPIVFLPSSDNSTLLVHVRIKNSFAAISCLYYESLIDTAGMRRVVSDIFV
jgi:hypothetical protein